MEFLHEIIIRHEYAGLFILVFLGVLCVPLPIEGPVLFAGFLMARGKLEVWPTCLATFGGVWSAVLMSFAIGLLARRLRRTEFLSVGWVGELRDKFARLERLALVFGLFVPGLRHFLGILAALLGLPASLFLPLSLVGSLLWAGGLLAAGFFFGEEWAQSFRTTHLVWIYGLAVASLGFILWRFLRAFYRAK